MRSGSDSGSGSSSDADRVLAECSGLFCVHVMGNSSMFVDSSSDTARRELLASKYPTAVAIHRRWHWPGSTSSSGSGASSNSSSSSRGGQPASAWARGAPQQLQQQQLLQQVQRHAGQEEAVWHVGFRSLAEAAAVVAHRLPTSVGPVMCLNWDSIGRHCGVAGAAHLVRFSFPHVTSTAKRSGGTGAGAGAGAGAGGWYSSSGGVASAAAPTPSVSKHQATNALKLMLGSTSFSEFMFDSIRIYCPVVATDAPGAFGSSYVGRMLVDIVPRGQQDADLLVNCGRPLSLGNHHSLPIFPFKQIICDVCQADHETASCQLRSGWIARFAFEDKLWPGVIEKLREVMTHELYVKWIWLGMDYASHHPSHIIHIAASPPPADSSLSLSLSLSSTTSRATPSSDAARDGALAVIKHMNKIFKQQLAHEGVAVLGMERVKCEMCCSRSHNMSACPLRSASMDKSDISRSLWSVMDEELSLYLVKLNDQMQQQLPADVQRCAEEEKQFVANAHREVDEWLCKLNQWCRRHVLSDRKCQCELGADLSVRFPERERRIRLNRTARAKHEKIARDFDASIRDHWNPAALAESRRLHALVPHLLCRFAHPTDEQVAVARRSPKARVLLAQLLGAAVAMDGEHEKVKAVVWKPLPPRRQTEVEPEEEDDDEVQIVEEKKKEGNEEKTEEKKKAKLPRVAIVRNGDGEEKRLGGAGAKEMAEMKAKIDADDATVRAAAAKTRGEREEKEKKEKKENEEKEEKEKAIRERARQRSVDESVMTEEEKHALRSKKATYTAPSPIPASASPPPPPHTPIFLPLPSSLPPLPPPPPPSGPIVNRNFSVAHPTLLIGAGSANQLQHPYSPRNPVLHADPDHAAAFGTHHGDPRSRSGSSEYGPPSRRNSTGGGGGGGWR